MTYSKVKPISGTNSVVKPKVNAVKNTSYNKPKTPTVDLKKVFSTNSPIPLTANIQSEEQTAPSLTIEEILASQLTDRRYAPVTADELSDKITYVTAGNGLFRVVKTPVAVFTTQINNNKMSVPGLPDMKEGVELLIPKIPFKHIIKALTFYRDVNKQDKTEAATLYFWNHNDLPLPQIPGVEAEGKLVTYCPKQVNSSALTSFGDDPDLKWFRENLSLLLELHSHNVMSAFFSGTDDANENMNQFYGVWGRVTSEHPEFVFRWVSGDSKITASPDILIDWPRYELKETINTIVKRELTINGPVEYISEEVGSNLSTETSTPQVKVVTETITGPFGRVEYPEEWIKTQHSVAVSTYNFNSKHKYNYNYNYGAINDYYAGEYYGEDYYGEQYYGKTTHSKQVGKSSAVGGATKKPAFQNINYDAFDDFDYEDIYQYDNAIEQRKISMFIGEDTSPSKMPYNPTLNVKQ